MNTLVIENWENIGSELKAAREKQGKIREEIAQNLSMNTLFLVENNKVKPTLPTLAEWLRALGYDEIIIRFNGG